MSAGERKPTLTIIAAVADNGAIGKGNGLPWHLPADLAHFKQTTKGHSVIMGRATFDTVGYPLPQRRNIVLSRQAGLQRQGAEVVASLDEALELTAEEDEVFLLGGGEIYKLALPRVDRMIITHVHAAPEADTFFPDIDFSKWKKTVLREHPADERNEHAMTFAVYERS